MEENQSLFGLNLDEQSKSFLGECARWGRFLAIMGFIICVLVIIAGIYLATSASQFDRTFAEYGGRTTATGLGGAMAIVYILVALIYFFPCLFLLRFANHMKAALAANDQANLTVSFQNLKSMFKFIGIFTIVILSIYIVAFIIGAGANM
ncbi:MAG: DUF5362 family protein [Chitinophagaceae bacterium]